MQREGKRILVVDDEPGICEGMELVLGREGFLVRQALSGEEALTLAESEAFDGVLLDMILPGLDGADTCRRLRQLQPRARIIAITGSPTGLRVDALVAEGSVDAFLFKPFGKQELLEIVRRIVGPA